MKEAATLINAISDLWSSAGIAGVVVLFLMVLVLIAVFSAFKAFRYTQKKEVALDACEKDRQELKIKVDNFETKVDNLNNINKTHQQRIETMIEKHDSEIKGVLAAHSESNKQFVKAVSDIAKSLR